MGMISRYVDGRINTILDSRNLNNERGYALYNDEDYINQRNKAFYELETEQLVRFFKTHRSKNFLSDTNIFYRVVKGNSPILHFPLANIITKTMTNLIFSKNPIINISTGKKKLDKEYNDLVYDIYDENSLSELLQKASEYESYSGAVGFKIVLDPDFSDNPIITVYPKEDMEVIKKYDRITEIIFKDYYTKDNNNYFLCSIYGKGYIDYKLYQITNNHKTKEISLDTLDETRGLKRLEFFNSDGTEYNKLLAIYKENKAGAKSDYCNLTDDFAALDEVYSNMINYIRKSKIKTYMPENQLLYNTVSGKRIIPNEYDSEYVILHDSNPEGTEQKTSRDIIDINNSIQGYKESFNNILLNALSTAGLSPCSVGLDMAGANSSALALNIRERTSLRTRSEKIKRWTKALENLTDLLISLKKAECSNEKCYVNNSVDYEITIQFPEYESPTYSDQINTLGLALQNNLIDLDTALSQLYPDLSDEEIQIMKMNIDGQLPDDEDIVQKELENDENSEEIDENSLK